MKKLSANMQKKRMGGTHLDNFVVVGRVYFKPRPDILAVLGLSRQAAPFWICQWGNSRLPIRRLGLLSLDQRLPCRWTLAFRYLVIGIRVCIFLKHLE
jgi:hypothetical protein